MEITQGRGTKGSTELSDAPSVPALSLQGCFLPLFLSFLLVLYPLVRLPNIQMLAKASSLLSLQSTRTLDDSGHSEYAQADARHRARALLSALRLSFPHLPAAPGNCCGGAQEQARGCPGVPHAEAPRGDEALRD